MSNVEIEEVYNKKVQFTLLNNEGKEFTEKNTLNNTSEYYVLWYDAKMKNYLMFLEYVQKKRMVHANIRGILIVDRPEYLANVEKIKSESSNKELRDEVIVMKKKVLNE
jgi:hypothetical protein